MSLTIKSIEQTVQLMDDTYDANFGEWIRNEDNCKIVGACLQKYIERYRASEIITVVKWIIKDWTLKSIILFTRKFVTDDILYKIGDDYAKRIEILTGYIYTWDSIFVSEFLLTVTSVFYKEARADVIVDVLRAFEDRKQTEILSQIEAKKEYPGGVELVGQLKRVVYKCPKQRTNRTGSLVDAFNLMM